MSRLAARILLITPPAKALRSGNAATASRWQGLLAELGFEVSVAHDYQGQDVDAMIAIHAWRSHRAIAAFRQCYSNRPLIVLLAGTDINRYLASDPDPTLHSLRIADRLIGLHNCVTEALPESARDKLRVVYQSAAQPLPRSEAKDGRVDVCVVGHIRDEKDSLRAAKAVAMLPSGSRVHVALYGRAETPQWHSAAVRESADNAHFHWHGEVSAQRIREAMACARAMVISSISEGGANVVSEACRAGLPVIASAIPGNIGLLGEGYPGYFPPGDTRALADRLVQVGSDPVWLEQLADCVHALSERFHPDAERAALGRVIRECL